MKKKFVANLTWKQLDSSLFLNKVADWSPAILLKRDSDTGVHRGGSMAAKISKMERFVIIVNGWKSFTIIAKRSILDVAAALDPPLYLVKTNQIILNRNVSLLFYTTRKTDEEKWKKESKLFLKLPMYNPNTFFNYILLWMQSKCFRKIEACSLLFTALS